MLTVEQINIFPIKSAAGLSPTESPVMVMPKGLEHDRRWMLIDENCKYITQRDKGCEILTSLQPEILPEGEGIQISFSGKNEKYSVHADDVLATEPVIVDFKGVPCRVFPAPRKINELLGDFLGRSVTLVHMPENSPRQTDINYAQPGDDTSLSDNFPLLITTQSSLEMIRSNPANNVDMARFRPNLVIAGAEPFAEEQWRFIQIGDVVIELVKPCPRCAIITIDQSTGEKTPGILKDLIMQHQGVDKKPYFGIYATPRAFGKIKVGQEIKILESHPGYEVLRDVKIGRPPGITL